MSFEQFKLSSVNASSLHNQCLEHLKLSNVSEVERKSVVYPCRGFVATDGKTEKNDTFLILHPLVLIIV